MFFFYPSFDAAIPCMPRAAMDEAAAGRGVKPVAPRGRYSLLASQVLSHVCTPAPPPSPPSCPALLFHFLSPPLLALIPLPLRRSKLRMRCKRGNRIGLRAPSGNSSRASGQRSNGQRCKDDAKTRHGRHNASAQNSLGSPIRVTAPRSPGRSLYPTYSSAPSIRRV